MTQTRGPGGPVVSPTDALRDILSSVPGGAGSEFTRDLDNIERIRAGPTAGGKKPEEMSPQELHAVLWQVLTFRDSGAYMRILLTKNYELNIFFRTVMKKISKTIGVSLVFPVKDKILTICSFDRKDSWPWSSARKAHGFNSWYVLSRTDSYRRWLIIISSFRFHYLGCM